MATLPSSEFRKTFARLTESVLVTSHGHRLGRWTPGDGDLEAVIAELDRDRNHLKVELAARDAQIRSLHIALGNKGRRAVPTRETVVADGTKGMTRG